MCVLRTPDYSQVTGQLTSVEVPPQKEESLSLDTVYLYIVSPNLTHFSCRGLIKSSKNDTMARRLDYREEGVGSN